VAAPLPEVPQQRKTMVRIEIDATPFSTIHFLTHLPAFKLQTMMKIAMSKNLIMTLAGKCMTI